MGSIQLCDEKSVNNHFSITATFEDGTLTVACHDCGLAPLRTWGTKEYKYRYIFDKKNYENLKKSLSEPGRDPTDEFKRRFSGISACRNLREFCKENRIDYAFENLSVYSEDDHLSVALDRPSEIPMFDSLESTVILEEYDSHPIPESTYCGPYKGLYGGDFLIAYFKDHGITDEEIELFVRWDCLPSGRMRSRLTANALGIKYAKDCAESIIAYRDVTANTLWDGKYPPPWEHPYSMSFYVINNIDRIPDELPIYDIYMCEYKGKRYYYGVGKEETPITEDMRHNGTWYVYTWDI